MKELKQKYIDILEENDWSVSSYTDDGRVEPTKRSSAEKNFNRDAFTVSLFSCSKIRITRYIGIVGAEKESCFVVIKSKQIGI